jgi:hypothetical protein
MPAIGLLVSAGAAFGQNAEDFVGVGNRLRQAPVVGVGKPTNMELMNGVVYIFRNAKQNDSQARRMRRTKLVRCEFERDILSHIQLLQSFEVTFEDYFALAKNAQKPSHLAVMKM